MYELKSPGVFFLCWVESVTEGRAAGETEKVGDVRNGETLDRRQTLTKLLVGVSRERSPEHRKGRRGLWTLEDLGARTPAPFFFRIFEEGFSTKAGYFNDCYLKVNSCSH